MPKEIVRTSAETSYHVRVGWHPGGGVQVGVEARDERSLFWELLGDPAMLTKLGVGIAKIAKTVEGDDEERGRAVLDMLDVVSNGGYAGVWSDLDRAGCNDLIRLVRRARDSAYGRDE